MNAAASRFNGTLKKWNAERGFGFVLADHAEQELFVHISAFPRDGRLPAIGERLSFDIELDRAGRKLAVRVQRPDTTPPRGPPSRQPEQAKGPARRAAHHAESPAWGLRGVVVLLVAVLGWFGYAQYAQRVRGSCAQVFSGDE